MAVLVERRADDWELRCRFNRAGYLERLRAGEFAAIVDASHLAPPEARQPPNTLSQIVYYLDHTQESRLQGSTNIFLKMETLAEAASLTQRGLL
jgi:hypothetical protein